MLRELSEVLAGRNPRRKESGFPYDEGTKVMATQTITESGAKPNPAAKNLLDPGWIHAQPGDIGVVVHVDRTRMIPTIKFERTGTATIVGPHEISKYRDLDAP
jgi:hypothetical protein